MLSHPLITTMMSVLARIPAFVFIVCFAGMFILSTQARQANVLGCWAAFNVLVPFVGISKGVTERWHENRQLFWHLIGHGIFLIGVVYAMQTPKITTEELLVFYVSTGLLLGQFRSLRWHETEFNKDLR